MSLLLRWGFVVTLLLVATAVVMSTWASYTTVRAASQVVVRGQAEGLVGSVRERLRTEPRPLSEASLAAVLADAADQGLTHLALYRDGRLDVSAGPSRCAGSAPATLPDSLALHVVTGTETCGRMVVPLVGRGPHLLALEVDRLLSVPLQTRARRALITGFAAGAGLLVAAVIFSWLLAQQERIRATLEEKRRLALLGEMSSVLAHEIRNPLASMKGHSQLLAERLSADAGASAKVERIVSDVVRVERLTETLLDFVRQGEVRRRPEDPGLLLLRVAERFPTVEVDLAEAPPRWSLDAERMRQVLTNLLQNAVQASPDDRSPVTASVSVHGGDLFFEVRDRGAGIAHGDEQRIFSPFFTTKTRGTGLGLAVSQRVAKLHGGEVSAANHPDGGALFRVRIPAA
jgi:two-component system sensor histidine kinase HydH